MLIIDAGLIPFKIGDIRLDYFTNFNFCDLKESKEYSKN